MPRMNDVTKLVYALEHVAHLHDLVEGNEYEKHLKGHIISLEVEFERQLKNEQHKRGIT
jgi:hypothetical protein